MTTQECANSPLIWTYEMNMFQRAIVAAVALLISAPSLANSWDGGYFVSADAGLARYQQLGPYVEGSRQDRNDLAGAVRFGYHWRGPFNFGFETGFVDLGKLKSRYSFGDYSLVGDVGARGFMLGADGTYRFDSPWHVSARAGLLRSAVNESYSYQNLPYGPDYGSSGSISRDEAGTGWYAGIGGGYDVTESFSIGLHYDNYRVRADFGGNSFSNNVAVFAVELEYRF